MKERYIVLNKDFMFIHKEFSLNIFIIELIRMATPSRARVCSSSLAGIAGSNPTKGMDVCLS
jgi:hypothetical protein